MAGYTDDAPYDGYGYGYGGGYGYDGGYAHPDAAAYLSGPGSTAAVGGSYFQSYAAENARGGIYTRNVSYYGTNETVASTYSYHGAAYGISASDVYIDYRVQTPGSPLGDGTRYGPAIPSGYGDLAAIDLYGTTRTSSSGGATYTASDSVTTEQFSSGYTIAYHSDTASESYGGHAVPGSQSSYGYATITDPSGYTTPFDGGQSVYYRAY